MLPYLNLSTGKTDHPLPWGIVQALPPAGAKLVGSNWLRRWLFLKGRVEVCTMYILLLILYQLSVLHLPKGYQQVLRQSLDTLLWRDGKLMVCRHVCCQCPSNADLGMPDWEGHWLAEKLAFLGRSLSGHAVWKHKVKEAFPDLVSNPKVESRHSQRADALFLIEYYKALCKLPWSNDLSQSWKELYQELVVGTTSDLLMERLNWSVEKIHSQWDWGSGLSFLNKSKFSLTLLEMCCSFKTGFSKWAWQTWLITSTAAEVLKKLLCTPSTIASRFTHFGITLGRRRVASTPNSMCCSMLGMSWTMLNLHGKVRNGWCFSQS